MKEEEIRPKKVFDEYLRLAALDAVVYFGNSSRQPLPCPACGTKGDFSFNKHGFSYEELNRIDDSRAIAVLNDAIKYRQIVAGKSKAEQKAKGAKPVIKPGSKKNQNQRGKAMERQRAKFKKSGRIEDVLGLIVNE